MIIILIIIIMIIIIIIIMIMDYLKFITHSLKLFFLPDVHNFSVKLSLKF